jgi:predicted nucleic acid-binding protein
MPPPNFYLETSVWGSLAARQPRDRQQVVHRLLRLLDDGRGTCVISDIVLAEIRGAPPTDSRRIGRRIELAKPVVCEINREVESLARAYTDAGVLPESRETDALHVAVATVAALDYLVSWNHRHMTRPTKRLQFASVKVLHGYPQTPWICNPFEACDELQY